MPGSKEGLDSSARMVVVPIASNFCPEFLCDSMDFEVDGEIV